MHSDQCRRAKRWAVFLLLSCTTLALWGEEKSAPGAPAVTFLNLDAAKEAILDDKGEPYFSTLQPAEMSAKTSALISGENLEAQRAECRKRYQAGMLQFSEEEQEVLQWYVGKIQPLLQAKYPLLAGIPWSFLKVSDSIEGGLPHTRSKHIVLAEQFTAILKMAKQRGPDNKALAIFGKTLVHEQIHVCQRAYPEIFAKLYTEVWGFKHHAKIESCAWLEERHLANPDGLDCGWAFPIKNGAETKWIWPLVIFAGNEGVQKMPTDFKEIAIDLQETPTGLQVKLDKEKQPVYRDLAEVPEYVTRFPFGDEIFHPNEISAVLFAEIFTLDAWVPKNKLDKEALDKLEKEIGAARKWFQENFKAK